MAAYDIDLAVVRTPRTSIAAQRRDAIVVTSGDDFRFVMTVYEDEKSLTPLNVANGEFVLSVMEDDSDERPLMVQGSIADAANGVVHFDVPYSATVDLEGRYRLYAQMGREEGASTLFRGIINIHQGPPAISGEGSTPTDPNAPSYPSITIDDVIVVFDEADTLPSISIDDLLVSFEEGAGTLQLAATTAEVNEGATVTLSVTRTGGAAGEVTVDYLAEGVTATVTDDFPATSGTLTWADGDTAPKLISIDIPTDLATDDDETFTVTLSDATGATIGDNSVATVTIKDLPAYTYDWLSTSGNQIVDESGDPVRLVAVNWFGAEGTNYTPHGTWQNSYKSQLNQIKAFGFNTIRLPFSGAMMTATPPVTAIDFDVNPEFEDKTALEIFDLIVDYAAQIGLRIVLDHHRRTAGNGADGSPVGGTYTEASWIATWEAMATRYAANKNVCGADLHNEPHDLTWSQWAAYAENCANAIHAINPNWLVFVEGVGAYDNEFYWWGGQLKGVTDRPISINTANKVVYSPHEYGHSVALQSWLQRDGFTVPNWPLNMYDVQGAAWGFIYEQNIAPIFIGEFGGWLGYDGSGNETKPYASYERQWLAEVLKYMNGDFDGDGNADHAGTAVGMSGAFWAYNPNSGDTGGLIEDDWLTPQDEKLALLAPFLT